MKNKTSEIMYLTVSDVSSYLNISKSQAYELTHRRNFPVSRFGGSIRIPRVPFLGWVAEHTSNPKNFGAEVA